MPYKNKALRKYEVALTIWTWVQFFQVWLHSNLIVILEKPYSHSVTLLYYKIRGGYDGCCCVFNSDSQTLLYLIMAWDSY
jgi:hypothetical protein